MSSFSSYLPAGQFIVAHAKVSERQAQNVGGGASTAGSYLTRVLNTEEMDVSGLLTLSSNRITLLPGSYIVSVRAPAYAAGRHQIRLQNVTDSTTVLLGSMAFNQGSAPLAQSDAFLTGQFTIESGKQLEIQHRVEIANALGWGIAGNYSAEIYTEAQFWKIGPPVDAPSGNWTLVADESGASIANFTVDSGAGWTSTGGVILDTHTTGGSRLRYTQRLPIASCVIEVECRVKAAGITAGDHVWGLLFNWDGVGSGATAVEFYGTSTTLATGVLRYQADGVAARHQISFPLVADQWYKLRCVLSGNVVSIYVDGVYRFSGAQAPGDADASYVGFYSGDTVTHAAEFRNFKVWRPKLPGE